MTVAIAVGVATAVIAALGAYLAAARQFSGKIETSDAKELWAESKAIRDWSTARIGTLNDDTQLLETRIDTLEASNELLAIENKKLSVEIAKLDEIIGKLRVEIKSLVLKLKVTKKELSKLEGAAGGGS